MNRQYRVREKLFGKNGHGSTYFTDDELEDLESQLKSLHNKLISGEMSLELAQMVSSIGAHIDSGTFANIAHRRGQSWRILAALADRIIEFEGLAKLHITAAALAADMQPILILKLFVTLQRLDLFDDLIPGLSFESQSVAKHILTNSREFVEKVAQDANNRFWADIARRMLGKYWEY